MAKKDEQNENTKAKTEKEKKDQITVSDEIEAYLKSHKSEHLNFEKEVFYRVSTGSLLLDIEIGGGITPGLHRFCGAPEGGKTSASLEVMKNFLEPVKKRKGVYFKAEGRLPPEMKDRSGVKFVTDPKEWVDGTCFIYECNVYESVIEFMRICVKDPDTLFCFILDSVDALQLRENVEKEIGAAAKPGGIASFSNQLLQKMNNHFSKVGHMAIFLSQIRGEIKMDSYTPSTPRLGNFSGGNALQHYPNFIFEFQQRYGKDMILENPAAKPDRMTNKIIGHWAKLMIKKSPNEKSGTLVLYPIKYGRTGGKSIWVEYEIVDTLLEFELLTKQGSWFAFDEGLREELKGKGIELVEKIQGLDNVRIYLEANPDMVTYFYKRFKDNLSKCK